MAWRENPEWIMQKWNEIFSADCTGWWNNELFSQVKIWQPISKLNFGPYPLCAGCVRRTWTDRSEIYCTFKPQVKQRESKIFPWESSAWWRVKRHLLLTPNNIRFLLLIADISPSWNREWRMEGQERSRRGLNKHKWRQLGCCILAVIF